MRHSSVVTFFLFVALLAASSGCDKSTVAQTGKAAGKDPAVLAASAAPPVRVTTILAVKKTLRRMSEQPGQVEAIETAPLHVKVAGFVKKVHVDIGDPIKTGEVLTLLFIPEMDQELKQKQALIEQANAEKTQSHAAVTVAEAGVAAAKAQVKQARAAVARTEADYQRWKSEFERYTELAAKAAVSQKLVEESRNQMLAADAARAETAAKIGSARAALLQSQALVEKAQADETAAQARWNVAEANLGHTRAMADYAKITAPFAGIVTRRYVHTGHFVQPSPGGRGEPLLVVMRTDSVRVLVDVPEADAALTDPGDEAFIRLPVLSAQEFSGTVTRTAWALDSSSRTLRTEIEVPNPDGKLRPGMYAYARVLLEEHPDVWTLPLAAVAIKGPQAFCFVVQNGKAVGKPLTLGLRVGTEVEIVSGLTGDEAVAAIAGVLTDGQAVEAVAAAKAP